MKTDIQLHSNGLHSGTIIEDLKGLEIHLHPDTEEVVVMNTTVVPDGGGCIAKESEVVAVFSSLIEFRSFISLIKK